jgi:hypothetical protein
VCVRTNWKLVVSTFVADVAFVFGIENRPGEKLTHEQIAATVVRGVDKVSFNTLSPTKTPDIRFWISAWVDKARRKGSSENGLLRCSKGGFLTPDEGCLSVAAGHSGKRVE